MSAYRFDDAEGYDRLMGRWSRAAGEAMLSWVAPRQGARWLDVGCGTGSFTGLIVETCLPCRVVAVDPERSLVAYANDRFAPGGVVQVSVADACALPFERSSFDVVVSALVLNFVADIPRCLSEMVRVSSPGGMVCGYVWDFSTGRSPTWPLREALKRLGHPVPDAPGASRTMPATIENYLAKAGLHHAATQVIEVRLNFNGFDEFWESQTAGSPIGKIIGKLSAVQRLDLQEQTRSQLSLAADGTFAYAARAHAFKGTA